MIYTRKQHTYISKYYIIDFQITKDIFKLKIFILYSLEHFKIYVNLGSFAFLDDIA